MPGCFSQKYSFFSIALVLFGLVLFGWLLLYPFSALGQSGEFGESLLDIAPPEIMQDEPAFTEQEFVRYLTDYGQAKDMGDKEADEFFTARGWSAKRLIYITVKTAIGFDATQNHSSSSPLDVPRVMLPTPDEQKIIEAHVQEIGKIFVVEH